MTHLGYRPVRVGHLGEQMPDEKRHQKGDTQKPYVYLMVSAAFYSHPAIVTGTSSYDVFKLNTIDELVADL